MNWNPSVFEFIKHYPTTYNIVYNDVQYTIKPSTHGMGLFANQDIERDMNSLLKMITENGTLN